MIPGSKGQKAVRACTIKLLNLGPAKYEEVAIYAVNQRIPNIWRVQCASGTRFAPTVVKRRLREQHSCGAIRDIKLGSKNLLTLTLFYIRIAHLLTRFNVVFGFSDNKTHWFLTSLQKSPIRYTMLFPSHLLSLVYLQRNMHRQRKSSKRIA